MNKLKSNWITGFTDAEGCFYIRLTRNNNYKTGWGVQAYFQIKLHTKDLNLLKQIKSYFNEVGNIYILTKNNIVFYQVRNLNDIVKVIIPHFLKYPLVTKKYDDFIIFKDIVELMEKGEHLNNEGVTKIVALKSSLNNGLSNKLKLLFSQVISNKSIINNKGNINNDWFAGFFSGDGCFFIDIFESKTCKTNYTVRLKILIGQHSKDELLVKSFLNFFKCGILTRYKNKKFIMYTISRFEDINDILIPLFKTHKIEGVKSLDFQDFCEAAEIINSKSHLTLEGLEKIKNIKLRMNKNRQIY